MTTTTPCREWLAYRNPSGYGQKYDKQLKKVVLIHRWVVAQIDGWSAIADKCVLHRCDNPACYRYDHLFIGTRPDNSADMKAKGRAAGAKGESHPKNRLAQSQVLEIYASTETHQSLADRYGVHKATVGSIKSGRNWSWLTNPARSSGRKQEVQ